MKLLEVELDAVANFAVDADGEDLTQGKACDILKKAIEFTEECSEKLEVLKTHLKLGKLAAAASPAPK